MKFKLYLILFIYFLSLSFVSSYTVTYQSNDGINFNSISYYCYQNLESCLSLETNPIYEKNNINSFSYNFDPTATSVIWKNIIFYCENSRTISSIKPSWGSGLTTTKLETMCPKYFTPAFGNYRVWINNNLAVTIPSSDFNNKDLQGNICKNDFTFNNNKITISTSLNPITKISSNDRYAIPEHLLEEYYYMKAEIKVDLYFSDEDDPENENYATTIDINENSKFVLVKPGSNTFNLNLPNKNSLEKDHYLNSEDVNYYWKITVTPIDLKCDFNNDGNLENNSKILENNEIKTISKRFPIEKNNKNICQPILDGPFNNEIFKVKINENQEINSTIFFKVFKKRLKGNSFYKKPVIEEEKNIKLSKTEEEINLTKDFDFDKNNLGFGEYKYEILIKTNDEYCHKNIKTAGFSSDKFKSENKIVKTISDDLIKKSFLKDKEHFGKKIGVSINGKKLYFDNRPLTFSNITSKVSIKQNGISKNESVEIRDIALISHKIKKLKNFEESQQLISNIENTFKNKKIYKNISSLNSQTKVDISVPNLQDDEKILIYFDKSVISRSQAPAWERVV